ncbi:MAG TPA: polysaccharide biosynthesis/export family protein [Pirellulaceae bacterium]|nr:polysaccharide biosynthesis/export family protein [Pirellulaceae bacterium]
MKETKRNPDTNQGQRRLSSRYILSSVCLTTLSLLALGTTGCSSLMTPISGVPAHRLPAQFHASPKNDLVLVDISRLRKPPSREYLVDAGDILGIYIESVLGTSDEAPPVHMPDRDSDLPPSIGFPIPVRENGTLPLPLVPSLEVRGLTLQQIENVIRRAYTVDQEILPRGKDRIIVTLMRKRTYHVVVMRQDGGIGDGETELSTRGQTVELEADKNDVLNALALTGGLPGLSAKNEVKILKSSRMDPLRRDQFIQQFYATPIGDTCLCRPPLPEDPAVIRIPLRLPPGVVPRFHADDVTLGDGDIVYIESREREVFYTGGLLGGGEHELPRDYDLDVLGALAIAGPGIASSSGGQGGGGFGGLGGAASVGGVPPGQLFILRKTPCNDQITIAVDLARAINSPGARPLIQPGDVLILQYKPEEEILNFGLGTFFTFGIQQLFQGNR